MIKYVTKKQRPSLLCLTGLYLAGFCMTESMFNLSPSYGANKVPTKRIFVPEETPYKPESKAITDAETDLKTSEQNAPQESVTSPPSDNSIPDDALPELPKPTYSRDEDEENSEPDLNKDFSAPAPQDDSPLPKIQYDISTLPEPVQRMRALILDTAKKGDIEKLRDLIGLGESATTLSFGVQSQDPIQFLKESSGDADGYEILAILIEVLETGYVHLNAGEEDEIYLWPYFFAWPLDRLPPEKKVELFRILTAGDVEDSENFGSYVFYRVGITPQGQWSFFVAGD